MSEQPDILQVEGINSKGFGIIPKLVMQDRRLTPFAKAIYAYFCSYAGAGRIAFPRIAKIISDIGISRNCYYSHFPLLKEFGYIKSEQEKDKAGKFKRNVYTLMEVVPCTTTSDTEPCTISRDTVSRDTAKRDTYIGIKNNSIKINSCKSNSPSVGKSDGHDRDIPQEMETHTELFRENIGYPDFIKAHPFDMRLIDEIIAIAVDVMLSDSQHVPIDGEMKPRAVVQHQLMLLDYEAIEHVVGQFKAVTGHIKKKRQYILTMLYNSRMEIDAHYTNEVRSDQ